MTHEVACSLIPGESQQMARLSTSKEGQPSFILKNGLEEKGRGGKQIPLS